jgi:drug/metabolite transporter superfamily protein YnfA
MWRDRALKVVLVLVGLVFSAGIYPLTACLRQPRTCGNTDVMMLSLYVTLGIFMLIAARNPSAHGSLIAFAAWSSLAHATVMALQAFLTGTHPEDFFGSAVLVIIGVALIVLAPTKQPF